MSSSQNIFRGKKCEKEARQRTREEVASPTAMAGCYKQGKRRTSPSLCQFLLHNFRTFRDSSAWNSVLSEKSWRARSDKKKLSQNTTAESLEIFLRIVYPEGEKGDKKKILPRVIVFPILPLFSGCKKERDGHLYFIGVLPHERI